MQESGHGRVLVPEYVALAVALEEDVGEQAHVTGTLAQRRLWHSRCNWLESAVWGEGELAEREPVKKSSTTA